MVLCLLSRDSHGDTTKLNHEETVRGPEIAISPEKSEILESLHGTAETSTTMPSLQCHCSSKRVNIERFLLNL